MCVITSFVSVYFVYLFPVENLNKLKQIALIKLLLKFLATPLSTINYMYIHYSYILCSKQCKS